MVEPTPADFGITTDHVDSVEWLRTRIFWAGSAAVVSGLAVGVLWGVLDGTVGFMGAILLLLLILGSSPMLASMACLLIFEPVAVLVSARHRKVRAYQQAAETYRAWFRRMQRQFWLSLKGIAFENELGALFARSGYAVEYTPASGDAGVDLILRRGEESVIVQCKAHAQPVGPAVARELYGVMQHADRRKKGAFEVR